MTDKFRDCLIGVCPVCREPVAKYEAHRYQFRRSWVVLHEDCAGADGVVADIGRVGKDGVQ